MKRLIALVALALAATACGRDTVSTTSEVVADPTSTTQATPTTSAQATTTTTTPPTTLPPTTTTTVPEPWASPRVVEGCCLLVAFSH